MYERLFVGDVGGGGGGEATFLCRLSHDYHLDIDRDVLTAYILQVFNQAIVSIYWVELFVRPWLLVIGI